ncbi:MAG: sensor domain-containing diguanylate cyclase [Novosphingobium sp.]|nr:sensor domain-containing diguanylate cyclase [Novosphingobium sp.]
MQDAGFLDRSEPIANTLSRVIFVLPMLTCGALVAALTFMNENPHPAIFVALVSLGFSIFFGVLLERGSVKELNARTAIAEQSLRAHHQMEELFSMTDMLQAAEGHEDAGSVLMATSKRLLPDFGGALYVFNNSRDRLDLAKAWSGDETFTPPDTLLPSSCWALKRGKPHINDPSENTLCCAHAIGSAATLEVPMMARGAVHGLLVLAIDTENSFQRLMNIRRLARAIADSISLALSNIALREKLQTQSLRDPLTGLYNRRYMEDALDRYVSLAERNRSSTSVVMIDLDNFKHLNDEYGHAKGDAVLCDVASQLVAALRPSDVVSRYGGEELLVILPDCGTQDAQLKAEMLRSRIEGLSEAHGVAISASLGIAAIPETSTSLADLIPMADAALYSAKQAGKNCVRVAERRSGKEEAQPRLAVG